MNLWWVEQTDADVPLDDDWLCAREELCLQSLRIPKRRADWRLGRWTAKRAVSASLPLLRAADGELEIRAAPSGAPEVFHRGERLCISISLTHRDGRAACAVASAGIALGCDLEVVEPHSDAFIHDYFAEDEQKQIAHAFASDRFAVVALLWSAKESALKMLHEGLRLDPRSVKVTATAFAQCPDARCWSPLQIDYDNVAYRGWWQKTGRMIRTLVSTAPELSVAEVKVS